MKLRMFFAAAMLAGMAFGTNVQAEEFVFEDFVAANTMGELVEQYGSVQITTTENGNTQVTYVDEEIYAVSSADMKERQLVLSPEESCARYISGETVQLHRYVNPIDADLGWAYRNQQLFYSESEEEMILSYEQQGEYTTVQAKIEEESLIKPYYELDEGDYMVCEYDVDTESLLIRGYREYIYKADGSIALMDYITFAYGVEKPYYVDSLVAEAKALDDLPEEEARICTSIVNPGAEDEKTVTQKVMKGSEFVFAKDFFEGYGVYTDPEGKVEYGSDGSEANADEITVYFIPIEE